MSTSSGSNMSRYLIIGVLGLVVGLVAGVMVFRSYQAKQDPFPDALMNVIAKQMGLVKGSLDANQCTVNDTMPRIHSLRYLANDLELAYPSLNTNPDFVQYSSHMRSVLDDAIANPPQDCASLGTFMGQLGGTCKECHTAFK